MSVGCLGHVLVGDVNHLNPVARKPINARLKVNGAIHIISLDKNVIKMLIKMLNLVKGKEKSESKLKDKVLSIIEFFFKVSTIPNNANRPFYSCG